MRSHGAIVVGLALSVIVAACGGDDDPVDAAADHDGPGIIDAHSGDATANDGALTDGAVTDAAEFDGNGLLGFMDDCDLGDDQCDDTLEPPLLCWDYPSKGPHCTHTCGGPDDCEPPSPGCTGTGVCSAP